MKTSSDQSRTLQTALSRESVRAAQSTMVFAGDSITDAGRRDDPLGLGNGFVSLIADQLSAWRVVNAGVSGDRIMELRHRWESEVLSCSPLIATVLIGVNDTGRRYAANEPTSASEFRAVYEEILSSAKAQGCALVLMTPFLIPIDTDQERWKVEDLDAKIAVTRALATKFDAILVDLQQVLEDVVVIHGGSAVCPDGVHPSALGHRAIASAWQQDTLELTRATE